MHFYNIYIYIIYIYIYMYIYIKNISSNIYIHNIYVIYIYIKNILSIAEKKSLTLFLSLLNFLFLLFFSRSIFSTIILKVGFELLFLLIYVKNLPEELSSEVEFFTDDTSLFIIVN